jgi:hypothetical protein
MKTAYLLSASLLIGICAMPAMASDRDHKGEHNSAQKAHYVDRDRDRDLHRESREARDRALRHEREERWRHEREERWRHERHEYARRDVPARSVPAASKPGWDHGQKRGWRGDDVPRGQAKKAYREEHGR